ncbi:MAG: SUMF1/EgtB/PvdO family nonheme iron enzyme [Chloroflexi bacterium]|nr:SUMF1/EgtB/PvdO family nonheme iron enzyme [Chloroflexota bacterium]
MSNDNDIVKLQQQIAELQARLAQAEAARPVSTQSGGVTVTGETTTVQGHVVGRDMITITYTGEDPQAPLALRRYLEWVRDTCAPLRLTDITKSAARSDQQPLGLKNVYVDLNLDFRVPADLSLAQYLHRQAAARSRERDHMPGRDDLSAHSEQRSVPALEALAYHPTMVLLGKPGSGKTTLSSYLALNLAEAGLGDEAALPRLGSNWPNTPVLPVRVILRKFAATLPAGLKQGRAVQLWQFIAAELTNCGLLAKTGTILQEVAAKSGALFIFDGLDEAGDEVRRTRVLEAVTEFMRGAGQQCRYLLTARPYAWDDSVSLPRADGLGAVYRLDDLDPDHINTFIERWYQAVAAIGWSLNDTPANKTLNLQAAVQRPDLQTLARNPLLLTLMATLHSNLTRLPDDRADLYNEVVDLLLQRWNETSGADLGLLTALDIPSLRLSSLRETIEQLAFDAHVAAGAQAASVGGPTGRPDTADISEVALLRAFDPLLKSWDKAAIVVDYIEQRAGLLIGQGARRGERQFTFPHRTFQEYLAAGHLVNRPNFGAQVVDLAQADPAHWREVLILAARCAGTERGVLAADALVHHLGVDDYLRQHLQPTERDWQAAILAGLQLLEIGLIAIDSREDYRVVRERVARWLQKLIETPRVLTLAERIEAGNTLGRLGDPRFPISTAPDGTRYIFPPITAVTAGPFEMGSHKDEPGAYDDEYSKATKNKRHVVQVDDFSPGVYPITNAEYHCFVTATAREAPRHWRNGEVPPGLENHPVVYVSWRDALAYGEWLSKLSGTLVRLPTEAEWEKAARWAVSKKSARRYPWGDEWDAGRCNTSEEGPGGTTPVGIYPDGASPSGLLDASGNVLEWVQSKWADYPYNAQDGREDLSGDESRVVRGGSWIGTEGSARCAYRDHYRPDSRLVSLGWRVVVFPGSRS